ncbi:recombinase family protein [Blastopirellula marina]|uniref:Site-specific recombinase and resolvase superfamily protein n=1 Tax=Blastopirellula marina DSM 3645 TaxID=314230 RepID=A3ZSK5_9BACT|nr:recombinase family protein [Blastopirellula marina]EAQ80665.1 Site-specific recombinase and resolvase superfamily protein [Blastopirellula marina DSM 3645]
MNQDIPSEGAASVQLSRYAVKCWSEQAAIFDFDLTWFDPETPMETRVDLAISKGYEIGTIYSRFSTKLQHSTDDQVRECIQWAAKYRIYVPPEFISIDEGVKGKKVQRDGLDRTKAILRQRLAKVLLVYKASRLFRQAGKGYQFINEEVVEEGLRAVIVSQGIDTNDRKTWKLQLQIHGIMDDMLLDAIADHVRSALTGKFLNKWTTGAIGIGYRRKEIPGAPLTNRGRPRTMPAVDPEAAELIREHAQLLLNGMPVSEGVRRWNADNGPVDPRASGNKLRYECYRKLFSNPRLKGTWEFGRRRNEFSSKLDNVKQVERPDDEVTTILCEELRILDDATFDALQVMFAAKKTGPRGPRKIKKLQLWDLTTEFFFCESCSTPETPVRFYQAGAQGQAMQCKNGDQCTCKSAVNRRDAVRAICVNLSQLILRDAELIEMIVLESQSLDAQADHGLDEQLARARKQLSLLSNRINDLFEMSGEGTEADRKETKGRLRAAQSERNAVQSEANRLQRAVDGTTSTMTVKQIRERLSEMSDLLSSAAEGDLGEDAIYKTLAVFRALTGGQIWVQVEQRVGRKRTNVRGTFRPQLLRGFGEPILRTDMPDTNLATVWLRSPPRVDAIAERAHELIDIQSMSHRETAKQLQREGHNVNSGNVWYSYRRWYEMQGMEPPKVPYNNGKKRRSA